MKPICWIVEGVRIESFVTAYNMARDVARCEGSIIPLLGERVGRPSIVVMVEP